MLVARIDDVELGELPGRLSGDPFPGGDAGNASVRVVRIEPGARTPHRHPRSVEVIYVVDGTGVHRQGAEERRIASRDLVLVPENVSHCTVADPGASLTLVCFFPVSDLQSNLVEEES